MEVMQEFSTPSGVPPAVMQKNFSFQIPDAEK